MEVSNLFVCLMGMGVTFIGLIGLIGLMAVMSKLVGGKSAPASAAVPAVSAAPAGGDIPNRQELIAAISAALAEEMGTDVTGIRILSLKKIS